MDKKLFPNKQKPKKTGRPLKLSFEPFKLEVDKYLQETKEANKLPTLTGLALRLDIDDLTNYGKLPRFAQEIKRIKNIASEQIIGKLFTTDKPLINHIFLAKAIAGLRDNSQLDITSNGASLGVVVLPKRGK